MQYGNASLAEHERESGVTYQVLPLTSFIREWVVHGFVLKHDLFSFGSPTALTDMHAFYLSIADASKCPAAMFDMTAGRMHQSCMRALL